jgi:hypothetical protein
VEMMCREEGSLFPMEILSREKIVPEDPCVYCTIYTLDFVISLFILNQALYAGCCYVLERKQWPKHY